MGWVAVSSVPDSIFESGVASAPAGGTIYKVAGENSSGTRSTIARAYDGATDTWSTITTYAAAVADVGVAADASTGKIYAVGGTQAGGTPTSSAYVYAGGSWSAITACPIAASRVPLVATGGKVYAFGGLLSSGISSTVYIYDIATNAWSTGAAFPGQCYYAAATLGTDGRIYLVGYHSSTVSSLYIYDPANDTFTTGASLPAVRQYPAVVADAGGRIWSIGGAYGGTSHSDVYVYDPATDTWATGTSLPSVAGRPGAALGGDGRIYVMQLDSPADAVYAITTNSPPNTATWSSPADGVSLDRTVDQVLTYVFSDPDSGDSQSARKWRSSTDGGTTWTETDETTVSTSITIAADTFANGATVQVQVMPADSLGTYAASWSASLHVTFEDPPSPPTITAPTSGSTIGSSTKTVTFSAPSLTQYKYRVVGDDGSGGPDTGTVYVAETTVINTASRSFTVTGLPNSTTVHIQVDIENDGLWSGYADQANPVSYDPPPTPTLTISPGTSTLTVTVATAAPGTGEVAAESVTVENSTDGSTAGDWRRSGQAINGDVTYETPASGQAYWFRATAYAASGVSAASAWTA